jgi:tetratricopeptide (TPR) repeat protein
MLSTLRRKTDPMDEDWEGRLRRVVDDSTDDSQLRMKWAEWLEAWLSADDSATGSATANALLDVWLRVLPSITNDEHRAVMDALVTGWVRGTTRAEPHPPSSYRLTATASSRFQQLMAQCLDHARREEWQATESTALDAVRVATGTDIAGLGLRQAAMNIVRGAVGQPGSTNDLRTGLERAGSQLGELHVAATEMGDRAVARTLGVFSEEVSAMLLLLPDASSSARVKLASKLRRVARPDLARPAAESALQVDRENPAAYVVLASCFIDMDEDAAARECLDSSPERNGYWWVTDSRLHRQLGALGRAVKSAQEALRRQPSQFTAENLAMCALKAEDHDALREAHDWLTTHRPDERDPQTLLLVLAGEAALREGDIHLAGEALAALPDTQWGRAGRLRRDYEQVRSIRDP